MLHSFRLHGGETPGDNVLYRTYKTSVHALDKILKTQIKTCHFCHHFLHLNTNVLALFFPRVSSDVDKMRQQKQNSCSFVLPTLLSKRPATVTTPWLTGSRCILTQKHVGVHSLVGRRPPILNMLTSVESLNLPPVLGNYVTKFATVSDPKLRYQQLLFLAKELPPMDSKLKTEENRVHGCTSVVFVNVTLDDDGNVLLQGDSDSQLTKGLLALLVNGLAGVPPADVARVDPQFIKFSGLATSLTPSRNNGFASMLAKIQHQVTSLSDKENGSPSSGANSSDAQDEDVGNTIGSTEPDEDPQRPVYSAIIRKLRVLKPASLQVVDNSAAHAGHAGAIGYDGESHFAIAVVADAFEGLSVVQRHRVIYTLLNEEFSAGWIHALQIDARTPSEV